MGLLAQWLADLDVDAFRRAHLQRAPLAQAGRARAAAEACSWDVLEELLRQPSDRDVLVVARGKELELAPPRDVAELRKLFARGIGVVIRHPERQSRVVRGLCAALAEDLPGEQRVLFFATPAGTHGFGRHYDPEDVFIVQATGDKEYYFRANTLVAEPPRHGHPDFSVYTRETSPLTSCRLAAGDWLYLPRGFWHVAHSHADSLSLSIGVFPSVTNA
jgi:50S ribosomal protein L16 3-hydroxylase